MKNAKIVAIAPTVVAVKMASTIVCAQKFACVDAAKCRKNGTPKMPKAAAAPNVGDAVMSGAVKAAKSGNES